MEVTSACIRQLKEMDLSESSKRMDGLSDSQYLSVPSGSTVGGTEIGEGSTVFCSSVAEQIEKSKSHWSLLAEEDAIDEDEEEAHVSNVRAFRALQSKWGDDFFYLFNQGGGKSTLEVGEKFAEGGQAELFHAKVKWGNPEKDEVDPEERREWVLKVFKEGTSLRQLQSNPRARPAFGEIVEVLLSNSTKARRFEGVLKVQYGKNFRSLHFNTVANP